MARIKPQALLQQSKKKKVPSKISATTIILFSLIVFMVVFFIFSTYRHFSNRSVNSVKDVSLGRKDPKDRGNPVVPNYATLHTSKGLIVVELYKDSSPEVVDKFIEFCQKGQFKGMQFHRVIKHYVIQAGEVNSIGAAEEWALRGKHYNKLDTSVKHEAFMVGTSKTKKDDKGFQLYITTAPIPDLNEKINVFGRVVKGEDVVQEIEEVDTDDHFVPKSAIGIMDVTLDHKA
ncbi:peptidyl-prolyl cis-trans isomerase CYP21-4-like [Silene latifolia]|uniref:peptidyl-prolyl cis-trans isomerase CYP21-4-like n=1 Tax=Silene latifolia TaxID=37657 RepID=UPI003D77462F